LNILIIGAGAAGYFGAIRAKEVFPEHDVTIIEAAARPLRKVAISGGGRCNVTHHQFDPALLTKSYPRGQKELRGIFARFQPKDTIDWFESKGVALKTEADGRMFPTTDRSATIISCLQDTAASLGVVVRLGERVEQLEFKDKKFLSTSSARGIETWDRILLATGSAREIHASIAQLGHKITELAPSLFTFKVSDPRIDGLAGLSFPLVSLELKIADKLFKQEGPLLLTHWGLSGPAVLKLSAWAARELATHKYHALLEVNFLPKSAKSFLENQLHSFRTNCARKKITSMNLENIPSRFWQRLVQASEVDSEKVCAELSNNEIERILNEIQKAKFTVDGKGEFKDEFVTCGGVDLAEVDMRRLESKLVPGLFFAGELLDVDGITGGFNFQNAWSTAWVAGTHIGLEK
jgi:predicted Rossmann fold flavoprotein